jgi:hypothetical protein
MHIFIDLPAYKPVKKKTPYPSHRACAHLMIENEKYQDWIMVHAYVRKGFDYKMYAWLERGGMVIDVFKMKVYKKADFYKRNRPVGVMMFDFQEVKMCMMFFGRYGRWDFF